MILQTSVITTNFRVTNEILSEMFCDTLAKAITLL